MHFQFQMYWSKKLLQVIDEYRNVYNSYSLLLQLIVGKLVTLHFEGILSSVKESS